MALNIQLIKELREKTGMGLGKCKEALERARGDPELALKELLKEGAKIAEKKASRATAEGVIGHYCHHNLRVAALVEVRCETDFVAKNEDFRNLANELAMQVAASAPLVIAREDLPEDLLQKKKDELLQDVSEKPPHILDKIVQGRLENFYREVCLLDQPYIKDENVTIHQVLESAIGKLGENIRVVRFARFEVGEAGNGPSV